MQYQTNSLMSKRLDGKDPVELGLSFPLEPALQSIVDDGLIVAGGMTFLRRLKKTSDTSGFTGDAVDSEMSVNNIFIDMLIPEENRTAAHSLQQGIAYAIALENKLIDERPGVTFKIIVSVEAGSGSDPVACKVGFHTSVGKDWLKDDLEGHSTNGLLVMSTMAKIHES